MDFSKRRKRKFYIISANPSKKRKSDFNLVAGMRGFMCTCNGYVKECIKEALNLLDEYDSKFNSISSSVTSDDHCIETDDDDDDDVEKQLKEEIYKEKKTEKKFKVVNTGANNCLFISTKANNVVEVAEKIVKDAKETAQAKNRYLIRLVPIEVTCKAYDEDIIKAAENLFDHHFKCEPTTYCIHINKRSNNNLLRKKVTADLARLVRDKNINHTVDLKTPSKTVVVEIIRNICCLSVINNFFEYKRYNLIELSTSKNSIVSKDNSIEDPENGNSNPQESERNEFIKEDVCVLPETPEKEKEESLNGSEVQNEVSGENEESKQIVNEEYQKN